MIQTALKISLKKPFEYSFSLASDSPLRLIFFNLIREKNTQKKLIAPSSVRWNKWWSGF